MSIVLCAKMEKILKTFGHIVSFKETHIHTHKYAFKLIFYIQYDLTEINIHFQSIMIALVLF